jgi:hypothetical protein
LYISFIILSFPVLGTIEVLSPLPSNGVLGYPQPCHELVVVYTRWLYPVVLHDSGNITVIVRAVVVLASKPPVCHDTVGKVIIERHTNLKTTICD